MPEQSWYRTWFDSPYYHLLYSNRDYSEAAHFIDRLLKYLAPTPNSNFLDIACGKGRHSHYIATKGYDVTGIDIAKTSISEAQNRASDHERFVVHDMRTTFQENTFDYVLNLFTSFGYFEAREENLNVLRSCLTNLKKRGKFILDFLNVEQVKNDLNPYEIITIDGCLFNIERKLENGVIKKIICVTDGSRTQEFQENVLALNKQDLIGMLLKVGFEILDIFGDYSLGQFYEQHSSRLVIIARK